MELRIAYARYRFALAGLGLALISGLGGPALAHVISKHWRLPFDPVLLTFGCVLAAAFLVVGFFLGRRVEHLADEARRDPVTRVGNRRCWEEALTHEVARASDARMPLSLLMVDVDNLKKLNDVGGHAAGDLALSIVGEVLNETCRSRDIAARFGGDEFAILLPRTRAFEARVVAERIRNGLRERRLGKKLIEDMLTVSIGIADLAAVETPEPHVLFEAADRALYAAKNGGRDRIEVAQPAAVVSAPPPRTSTVIFLDDVRRAKRKSSGGIA